MNQITSRKVTRWYLDGKGYATRSAAYKKLAYKHLLDELLGESVDGHSRTKLEGKSDDEAKKIMYDVFAEKFPHEVSSRCDYVCRKNWKNVWTAEGPDTEEDGFAFESCKAAQQDWIKSKAEELYE